MARPTVMTEEVIKALRQAFLVGATNEEAAHYAGIAPSTIYSYIEKHPEFSEQIEGWKSEPILKAKQTVVRNIDKDVKVGQWYLERKAKDFKAKADITSGDNPIQALLNAYGIEGGDEPKNDESIQGSPSSKT